MSRWTTTTLAVACGSVIGCCEHMIRRDPLVFPFILGTLTLPHQPINLRPPFVFIPSYIIDCY